MKTTIAIVFAATALIGWSPPATAQQEELSSGLSRILQGLQWGESHEQVLAHYRDLYLEDYRSEIAGLRDPLEIDEIRRHHDRRYQRVEESYEEFDGTRTGYEVSVLGGEVVGGNNESMLTVRTDNAMLYYIFATDQLFKIVVAYNSAYLGGLEFDSFIERVERRYGPAMSTEVEETATGVRYLARARWEDVDTRLRVENRSNIFGTFVMVFTNPALEDRVVLQRGGVAAEDSAVSISPRVRSLSEDRGSTGHDDIVDQIIGAPIQVELVVPEEEPVDFARPEEAAPMTESEMAEQAEASEEAAEDEAEERPRTRRDRDEDEEPEEEGITIY